MAESNFFDVWGRIVSVTPIKNLKQLADIIGNSHQNISKRKKEGIFPAEWAFKIAREYNISTDWIMTGDGTRNLDGEQDNLFRGSLAEWIREMAKENPDFWMEFSIRCATDIPEFKEWLKKRKAPVVSGSDQGQLAA